MGPPASYQAKLQKLFPNTVVTVAKKADSLYPIVSAASVCAKVTRDACLELSLPRTTSNGEAKIQQVGSGYPGDAKTIAWLKNNKDPVFGWPGSIARFSWGTARDMLEMKGEVKVEWAEAPDEEGQATLSFFNSTSDAAMGKWYGRSAGMDF